MAHEHGHAQHVHVHAHGHVHAPVHAHVHVMRVDRAAFLIDPKYILEGCMHAAWHVHAHAHGHAHARRENGAQKFATGSTR